METTVVPAPAKVNLSLRVLRRREDGFHEIDTLMVRLPGLHDTLTLTPAEKFSLACDDPSLPVDEGNLVTRAARAYEVALGKSCGVAVALEKRIPHAAGLGGGSSDAAATLAGLDAMHGHALGRERLMQIAAGLGSDIPFFLGTGAARCTGRGEVIAPVETPGPFRVLLLKPDFGVSTPDAYRRWVEAREIPGIPYEPQRVGGFEFCNDLERPVFAKHRFLAEMKKWLTARVKVKAVMMCGSGSTMCAVIGHGVDAEKLVGMAKEALDPNLWHWVGETEGEAAERGSATDV